MLLKRRVLPLAPTGLQLRAAVGWGVVAGALSLALSGLSINRTSGPASGGWELGLRFAISLLALLVFLLPFALFMLSAPRRWHRLRWAVAASLMFLAGFGAAQYLQYAWADTGLDNGALSALVPSIPMLWRVCALVGLCSAVAFLLVRLLAPATRQNGHLCFGCGYDLVGLPPGALCPECGRPSDRSPGHAGVTKIERHLARWGCWAALATVVVPGTIYAARWQATVPARQRLFESLGDVQFVGGLCVAPPSLTLQRAWGVFVPFADSSGQGVAVLVPDDESLPPKRMQVRLAALRSDDGYPVLIELSPGAYSDLDAQQVEQVIARGLPPGLIEAFRAFGGPEPRVSYSTLTGVSSWVGRGGWPMRIDPAPSFSSAKESQ